MNAQSPLQIGRECFLTALGRTLVVEILGVSAETIWVSYPMADAIKEGTAAELCLHESAGFIGFHTRVSSSPKPNQPSMMLQRTESAQQSKARKHWRVPTEMIASIRVHEEAQYHDARLCDLSIEGALIVTPAQLSTGSMLEMTFQLPNEAPHAILLQIVYSAPDSEKGENRYGLRFIEVSEEAHEALLSFLQGKIQELYPHQPRDLYPRHIREE